MECCGDRRATKRLSEGRWSSPSFQLLVLIAAFAVTVVVLAGVDAGSASAAATTAPVTSDIDETIGGDDVWSGGMVVVGDQSMIGSRDLLLDSQSHRLTLRDLFHSARPACRGPPAESGLTNCGNVHKGIEAVAGTASSPATPTASSASTAISATRTRAA